MCRCSKAKCIIKRNKPTEETTQGVQHLNPLTTGRQNGDKVMGMQHFFCHSQHDNFFLEVCNNYISHTCWRIESFVGALKIYN